MAFETMDADPSSMRHLFTDGACRRIGPHVALAAWSVQNATNRRSIAAEPLNGGKQTAHRAGLQAIHSAISWENGADVPIGTTWIPLTP